MYICGSGGQRQAACDQSIHLQTCTEVQCLQQRTQQEHQCATVTAVRHCWHQSVRHGLSAWPCWGCWPWRTCSTVPPSQHAPHTCVVLQVGHGAVQAPPQGAGQWHAPQLLPCTCTAYIMRPPAVKQFWLPEVAGHRGGRGRGLPAATRRTGCEGHFMASPCAAC